MRVELLGFTELMYCMLRRNHRRRHRHRHHRRQRHFHRPFTISGTIIARDFDLSVRKTQAHKNTSR